MVKSSRATREKLAHGLLKGFFAGAVYFAVIARGDKSHFKDRSWFRDVVDARAMRTLVIVVPINGVVPPGGLRGRWCHASQLTRSRFASRFNLCRPSTGLQYDKTKKRTGNPNFYEERLDSSNILSPIITK